MKITPGCSQNIGSRKQQQDAFGFSHIEDTALVQRAGVLAVLADGMGGLALGQEAATTAVQTALQLHEQLDLSLTTPPAFLADVVEQANDAVLDMARKAGVEGDAGATLLLVLLQDSCLHWASAGDSRIYLCRGTELARLTADQNHYTDLLAKVSSGVMTIEQARSDPDRAALVNYIGNPDLKPADASIRPLPLQQHDWLLLCSDGLFGTLSTEEILAELHGSPQAAAERLISKTLSKNRANQDNVTVAILGTGDREPVTVRVPKRAMPSDDLVMPVASARRRFGLTDLLLGVVIAALVVAGGMYGMKRLAKDTKPAEQQIAPIQKSISGFAIAQKAVSSANGKKVEQHKEQKP